ncbi:MAG TPA: PilZ domain-containing protein [archaeon]|nr:PilZ domain-containing protein [archaeon]
MSKIPKKSDYRIPPSGDRRSVPRFRFTARAEVVDHASDVVLAGRIVRISQTGCYVNTLSAPPAGTQIRLRITHGLDTFKSAGKVIHAEPGTGMGVEFVDIAEDQQKILSAWIAELGVPE